MQRRPADHATIVLSSFGYLRQKKTNRQYSEALHKVLCILIKPRAKKTQLIQIIEKVPDQVVAIDNRFGLVLSDSKYLIYLSRATVARCVACSLRILRSFDAYLTPKPCSNTLLVSSRERPETSG
jgi:hypothetical protein